MQVNNNLSVLPFYKNLEWQKHNLPYSYGGFFPLITASNMILPFQIIRDHREAAVTSVELYNRYGVMIEEMLPKMDEAGLQLIQFPALGYDIILYPSKFPFGLQYNEGFHYLRITDGEEVWFSEIFTFVNEPYNYLKLEWSNLTNIEGENGGVLYRHPDYENYMYLFSEVAKPEYIYEEEGENRDGEFFPEKQISWKKYNFVFLATEPMLDVLRLVSMADFIRVRNRTRQYECRSMLITPAEWVTGDISSVEAEFTTDTIVKKMGGMFNNDFNCCGGSNPGPGSCELPVLISITGEVNPASGTTQTYVLSKTGGSGNPQIQWVVTGGTIQGTDNGNTLVVQWGAAGAGSVHVELTCDGVDSIESTKPVNVQQNCSAASAVMITGNSSGIVNSIFSYNAVITGGFGQNIVWSVSGGTIIGGQGASEVLIQWGNVPGNYNISVSVQCGINSVSDTHAFQVTGGGSCVVPATLTVNGPASAVSGGSATYTLTGDVNGPGAEHIVLWEVTGGTIVGSNSNYTGCTVQWGAAGSGTIKCTVSCAGGGSITSPTRTISISGSCSIPTDATISGPASVFDGEQKTYTVLPVGGSGYSFEWFVAGSASIVGSNVGSSVQVLFTQGLDVGYPNSANVSVYMRCNEDVWLMRNVSIEIEEASFLVMSKFIDGPQPSGINQTVWTPFSNFTPLVGVKNAFGDGSPAWADDPVNGSGKLLVFDKGLTNLWDVAAFARAKWTPQNIYAWSQCYYMFNNAVRECVAAGKTGVVGGTDYGDMNATTAPGDLWNTNIPYYNLTVAGMIEVGKRMNWGVSNSIDDPAWNISGDWAMLMIDEESMHPYNWAGGHHNEMLGYITQGIQEMCSNNKVLNWYAQPISWAFNNMRNLRQSDGSYLDSDILALFSPSNVLYGSPGFAGKNFNVETTGGYRKVPGLSGYNIFDHDGGGAIIMVGGKRKYRSADFTVSHYGTTETILAQPHDWIKWNGKRADNSDFYGWQSEWGPNVGQDMTFSLPSGWSWGNTARPNPASWRTEAELWRDGMYTRANGIIHDQLCINYREKGVWLTSEATTRIKSYQELRPRTEPWTADGNSIEIREIGVDGIAFDTIFFAYCGGQIFSTWDDGGSVIPRPNKPGQLWGEDQFYGRYQTRLSAFRQAYNELQGLNPTSFKYAIFYYPFKGQNNNEIIAAGIYHGTRFYFCCLDPNREHNENWTLQLCVGASVFNLQCSGHDLYLRNFDVSAGLNPQDMTVEYTTIYGMHIKTNGRIQNTFSAHYE